MIGETAPWKPLWMLIWQRHLTLQQLPPPNRAVRGRCCIWCRSSACAVNRAMMPAIWPWKLAIRREGIAARLQSRCSTVTPASVCTPPGRTSATAPRAPSSWRQNYGFALCAKQRYDSAGETSECALWSTRVQTTAIPSTPIPAQRQRQLWQFHRWTASLPAPGKHSRLPAARLSELFGQQFVACFRRRHAAIRRRPLPARFTVWRHRGHRRGWIDTPLADAAALRGRQRCAFT